MQCAKLNLVLVGKILVFSLLMSNSVKVICWSKSIFIGPCYFHEGPQLPKKIRALVSYREYTFAAYGNDIAVFKRAHQV